MTQANLAQSIMSGLGYANNIEPNDPRGGMDLGEWPGAGASENFLDRITMEPEKFRFKKGANLIEHDCIQVRFWFTLNNDPAVAAGKRPEALKWGGAPIDLISASAYASLPAQKGTEGGNQKQRVDIQYGRLLGSLSALLGRKVTMGEIEAAIKTVNDNATDSTPVICRVLVNRKPRTDKPNAGEDMKEQVTEVISM